MSRPARAKKKIMDERKKDWRKNPGMNIPGPSGHFRLIPLASARDQRRTRTLQLGSALRIAARPSGPTSVFWMYRCLSWVSE